MTEVKEIKQKPLDLKVKTKTDTLIPLAPSQTGRVIEDFSSKGATFFDWEEFQRLTKDLPPNTLIADILASLRGKK